MRNLLNVRATMVADEFIDRYMPEANGEYVKVYLYILRHQERPVTVVEIADALNHTESDIRRAMAYWERIGVLDKDSGAEQGDRRQKAASEKAGMVGITGMAGTAAGTAGKAGLDRAVTGRPLWADAEETASGELTGQDVIRVVYGKRNLANTAEKPEKVRTASEKADPAGKPERTAAAEAGFGGADQADGAKAASGKPDGADQLKTAENVTEKAAENAARPEAPAKEPSAEIRKQRSAAAGPDGKDVSPEIAAAAGIDSGKSRQTAGIDPEKPRQTAGIDLGKLRQTAGIDPEKPRQAAGIDSGKQRQAAAAPEGEETGTAEQTQADPQQDSRPLYTPEQVKRLTEEEEFTQLLYVAQKYLNKIFTPRECEVFAYLYDGLKMPAELLEYLVEFCVEGGHYSIRYLETVGINWHERGIFTIEMAKQYSAASTGDAFAVMKAFGLNDRRPGDSEMGIIRRWFKEWGFSRELVMEACARTLKATNKPSFAYTDRILMEWKRAGVKTLNDVKKLDAQREAQNGQQARTAETRTSAAREEKAAGDQRGSRTAPAARNRFHNFEQRDTDYDEMALKQIRERLGGK